MGWKTDWLYGLIFSEIRCVWDRAHQNATRSPGLMGQAPDSFVVRQFAAGDVMHSRCLPPVQRQWIYRGEDTFEPFIGDLQSDPGVDSIRRGAFYVTGNVAFHIAFDRKAIILAYGLGPRYGQGRAHQVIGQGRRGRLAGLEGSIGWQA